MQSFIRVALVLLISIPSFAGTPFWPDTNLTEETANNTSASSDFKTQANGNVAPGNVSSASIRTLLYPDADTLIMATLSPVYGGADHMDVGYRSDDPNQVMRQLADMKRRGISGVVVEWYGRSSDREERTARYVRGFVDMDFRFALMETAGALKTCANTPGCDLTTRVIADISYILNSYANNWSYLRVDSRPVIFCYGLEQYSVDWALVRSRVGWKPLFVFRDPAGFTHAESEGAYAWIAPVLTEYSGYQSTAYLQGFYETAAEQPTMFPAGSAFKGFDDSLHPQSPGSRGHVAQLCGKTWLDSLGMVSTYYSSERQLPVLQLVSWNNYEEGTEIETGIDNCVAVDAKVDKSVLSWTITGSDSTIQEFRIFVSQDGEALMTVADLPASKRSLDLATYGLPDGKYWAFVQAVGKPSILNHISPPAKYLQGVADDPEDPPTDPTDPDDPGTPGGNPDDPGNPTDPGNPDGGGNELSVSVLPSLVRINQGENGTANVNVYGGSDVQFDCAGLPEYATCSFGPAMAATGSTASTVTIRTSQTVRVSSARQHHVFLFASFCLVGVVAIGSSRRKTSALMLAIYCLLGAASCGGNAGSGAESHPELMLAPKGEFRVVIKAISGSSQASTTITVVVK